MVSSLNAFFNFRGELTLPLDHSIPIEQYCTLDLATSNADIESIEITNPNSCQDYIDTVLLKNNAMVAFGGYLEKRNIYGDKSSFVQKDDIRNIHLGIDFWAKAGTLVMTPLNGKVHSFQNNYKIGDYGPTIILQHEVNGFEFHTLYGHLSLESIQNLEIGQDFKKGSELATLGTSDINVNYAPHLHFQIIIDMEDKKGDYLGVCSEDNVAFYKTNCPDPNLLLKF